MQDISTIIKLNSIEQVQKVIEVLKSSNECIQTHIFNLVELKKITGIESLVQELSIAADLQGNSRDILVVQDILIKECTTNVSNIMSRIQRMPAVTKMRLMHAFQNGEIKNVSDLCSWFIRQHSPNT